MAIWRPVFPVQRLSIYTRYCTGVLYWSVLIVSLFSIQVHHLMKSKSFSFPLLRRGELGTLSDLIAFFVESIEAGIDINSTVEYCIAVSREIPRAEAIGTGVSAVPSCLLVIQRIKS